MFEHLKFNFTLLLKLSLGFFRIQSIQLIKIHDYLLKIRINTSQFHSIADSHYIKVSQYDTTLVNRTTLIPLNMKMSILKAFKILKYN